MSKIRDYLELVRIPNVFTAQADILAGFLIAGADKSAILNLIFLLLSSSCLYSGGMVFNDYFDYATDLTERPQRPLPSGRINKSRGLAFGVLLLLCGILFSTIAGKESLVISLFLITAILAYDGLLKRSGFFGPLGMGSCRYLNLLLGLSVVSLEKSSFMIPLITGVYISGVTLASRSEAGTFNRLQIVKSMAVIASVIVLFWMIKQNGLMPYGWGAVLLAFWAAGITFLLARALAEKNQASVRFAVKCMILSLIGLDGILVAGSRGLALAVPVWVLAVPTIFISKRFYVT